MLQGPVSISPCAHNICKGCYEDHKLTECPKCDKKIEKVIEDKLVDQIVTKFKFQNSTLDAFKNEAVWKNVASEALKEQNS